MPPKLTIGMAVFNDFDGVYFSLQALRLYHAAAMADVELIVVDNAPDAPGGRAMLEPLLNNAAVGCAGAKYIAMPEKTGTSQPRNAIFAHGTGDAVVCMDSHVFLKPGAIARLIEFYDAHPETLDLFSGPMLYDDLRHFETHFDDLFRAEMWGVWGRAWICKCAAEKTATDETRIEHGSEERKKESVEISVSSVAEPLLFSVRDNPRGEHPFAEFRAVKPGSIPVSLCGRCGQRLPEKLAFSGSFQALEALGYRPLGTRDDDEPFEIPAMGLGLFSCRREAWLEFNKNFRGFGGEEMYVHEKYRQAGRNNVCLPWLKWSHRFGRANGVSYPLTRYNKVRNYVLGHNELGLDLAPVKGHFVPLMPEVEWDFLVSDPVAHTQEVAHAKFAAPAAAGATKNPSGQPLPPHDVQTPEALLTWFAARPRDLNEHLPRLAELAGQCSHVTEFSARRESTIGLLAGKPERLVSFNVEDDLILRELPKRFPGVSIEAQRSRDVPAIEDTDLLFLDSEHTFARLSAELAGYAPNVRRFIVLHDTAVHAATGEDGGPGLVPAIKDFLANNREWFVHSHTQAQYGLSVLGRREEDRPVERVWLWPPGFGPGTELMAVTALLKIADKPGCDCKGKALQMDFWGAAGCRAVHPVDEPLFGAVGKAGTPRFETIVGWMRDGFQRWGWAEKLTAAANAVVSGVAFEVNWADPFPDIIEGAIRRSEENGEPGASASG